MVFKFQNRDRNDHECIKNVHQKQYNDKFIEPINFSATYDDDWWYAWWCAKSKYNAGQ